MAQENEAEKLRQLKSELKSLVVSNPSKMKLRNLMHDYKEFCGSDIPISQFGYNSIIKFIKEECLDVFQLEGDSFNPTLCPIITKEIQQLDKFISRQKTPANKIWSEKRSRIIDTNPSDYKNQTSFRRNNFSNQKNDYICKTDSSSSSSTTSTSFANTYTKNRLQPTVEESPRYNPPRMRNIKKVPQLCVNNLKILIDKFPEGLWSCNLLDEYTKMFKRQLNLAFLNYTSVIELCMDLTQVFKIIRPQSLGDWKLFPLRIDVSSMQAVNHEEKKNDKLVDSETPAENYMGDDALPGIDYHPSLYPSGCVDWVTVLPVLPQPEKGIMEVSLSEVRDPSHFWYTTQSPKTTGALDTLMDNMDIFYKNPSNSEPLRMPRPLARIGQNCACSYCDSFHRAVIVNDMDIDHVQVRYVDYGTVQVVPATQLFHLHSQFSHLPRQALRGRLMNLKPALGATSWSQAARRRFLTLIKYKTLVAKIMGFDTQENVVSMALIDTSGAKDIHINDVLYSEKLADIITEVEGHHTADEGHTYLLPSFEDLENGRAKSFAELEIFERESLFEEFANKEKTLSISLSNSITVLNDTAIIDTASCSSSDTASEISPEYAYSDTEKEECTEFQHSPSNISSDMNTSHPSINVDNVNNLPVLTPAISRYPPSVNIRPTLTSPINRYSPPVNVRRTLVPPISRYSPPVNIRPILMPHFMRYSPPVNCPPQHNLYRYPPQAVCHPQPFIQTPIHNQNNLQYNGYSPVCYPDPNVYHGSQTQQNFYGNNQYGRPPFNYNNNSYKQIRNPFISSNFTHQTVTNFNNINRETQQNFNNFKNPDIEKYNKTINKSTIPYLPNRIGNHSIQIEEKLQNNRQINNCIDNNLQLYGNQKNVATADTKSLLNFDNFNDTLIILNEEKERVKAEFKMKINKRLTDSPSRSIAKNAPMNNIQLESACAPREYTTCEIVNDIESNVCNDFQDLTITRDVSVEDSVPEEKATLIKVEIILNRILEIWLWDDKPCILLQQAACQLLTSQGRYKLQNMDRNDVSPNHLILINESVARTVLSNLKEDGVSGMLIGESISGYCEPRCDEKILIFVPFKYIVATLRNYRPHIQVTTSEIFTIASSLTASFKST